MNETAKNALRDVNKIRKAFGVPRLRDLRKGERERRYSCPIANSLNDVVEHIGVTNVSLSVCKTANQPIVAAALGENEDFYSTTVQITPELKDFIEAFDEGHLSEYELKSN